jgi:PKD repeat protein
MTNWVEYSNGLLKGTIGNNRIYCKLSHYQEKIRVAGWRGIQEIPFYESYTSPIAQPTTNSKEICINQPVKLADYSIINYSGATWQWSFSKNAIYLNGTNSTSQNPEVKFLTPGAVNVSLTVTDIIGINNTKTINNFINVNYDSSSCLLLN